MSVNTDILTNDSGDLACVNGDFEVGESSVQHIEDILISSPGEYKQNPLIGASIRQALNGSLDGDLKRMIQINLERDGFTVNSILQDDSGNIQIDCQ